MNVLTKALPAILALGIVAAGPATAEVPDRGIHFGQSDAGSIAERAVTLGEIEDSLDEVMLERGGDRRDSDLIVNDVKNYQHITVK